MRVGPVPVELACEFWVKDETRGTFWRGAGLRISMAGEVAWPFGSHIQYPEHYPEKLTVILRASREVARLTMDMTRIWDGELVFPDVPVYYGLPWETPPRTGEAPKAEPERQE